MSYGFSESRKIKNKNIAKQNWDALYEGQKIKHYVNINGRDVEVPSPNNLSISKKVCDAINPIHIK